LLPKDINFSEVSQSTGDDATASTGNLNQFEIKAQAEALVAAKLAAGTKITFLQAVDEVTGGTN
jgi:preprotein translocase subunit Sec63